MSDNRPIGVFDSGLGGLTVVKHINQLLTNERFIYFGDTARTPYGSKSVSTIKKFSIQITDFLIRQNVKMIVIACNTVSATCINDLQRKYPNVPVIGIIEPTVKRVVEEYDDSQVIGIIGTKVTINSRQYEIMIKRFRQECKVFSKACPLFVPMIEEGIKDVVLRKEVVKYYLDFFLKDNGITDLVLGCTHYPLLQDTIKKLYKSINIINPSEIVAKEIETILEKNNMKSLKKDGVNRFFASDLSECFRIMVDDMFLLEHRVIDFKNFDRAVDF